MADLSLGVVQNALEDVGSELNFDPKVLLSTPRPLLLLFKGVVYVVLLPSLEKVFQKKLKIMAKPLIWAGEKALINPLFAVVEPILTPKEGKLEREFHDVANTDGVDDKQADKTELTDNDEQGDVVISRKKHLIDKMAQTIASVRKSVVKLVSVSRITITAPFYLTAAAVLFFTLVPFLWLFVDVLS